MASLFFWKPKIIPYFQENNLLFPASLLLYHEIKSPVCSVASHHIGQIGDSSLISYFIFITIIHAHSQHPAFHRKTYRP